MLTIKKMFDSVFVWGIIILLGVSTYVMHEFLILFKEEQRIQQQEGKCIAQLISNGIERKYIATGAGTCWSIEPIN